MSVAPFILLSPGSMVEEGADVLQNAGVHAPKRPIEELSAEDIRSVFDINILGPVLCAQEAIKIMKSQEPKGGRLVYICFTRTPAWPWYRLFWRNH